MRGISSSHLCGGWCTIRRLPSVLSGEIVFSHLTFKDSCSFLILSYSLHFKARLTINCSGATIVLIYLLKPWNAALIFWAIVWFIPVLSLFRDDKYAPTLLNSPVELQSQVWTLQHDWSNIAAWHKDIKQAYYLASFTTYTSDCLNFKNKFQTFMC